MIVFYHKDTGHIFGTMNGFNSDNKMVKPANVEEVMVGVKILDVKFENKHDDIIRDILSYKVIKNKLVKK